MAIHDSTISRRNLMRGVAATALAAGGPGVAVAALADDDELLLALEREWRRREDYFNGLEEYSDDEATRLGDWCWEIEREILDTPARTLAGVAVKLRFFARVDEGANFDIGSLGLPSEWGDNGDAAALSALVDCERLLAGGVS